jgi:hypothetical protein
MTGGLAAAGAAATAVALGLIRPWYLRWGATDQEVHRALPGDDEVQRPWLASTRAITIHAPPEAVWPWLVQMGASSRGRAGWYSYDRIDNGGTPSAERILPEWQRLQVGDFVPEGPEVGWTVAALEPNRLLVLVTHGPMQGLDYVAWRDSSWALALAPLADRHRRQHRCTRLVERGRTAMRLRGGRLVSFLIRAIIDPGDFLMARRQMLNIKHRAEQTLGRTG